MLEDGTHLLGKEGARFPKFDFLCMDVGDRGWRDVASVEAQTVGDVNHILDRSSLLHGDNRTMGLETWVAPFLVTNGT